MDEDALVTLFAELAAADRAALEEALTDGERSPGDRARDGGEGPA